MVVVHTYAQFDQSWVLLAENVIRTSGSVLYGRSPLVSVPFLNTTWGVTRAVWYSFVSMEGLGNSGTLSSTLPQQKPELKLPAGILVPPWSKSLSHLLQLALLGPWRGNCTTCCTRPAALPLCFRSLFGKMFSAHKSSGWSFGQRGRREPASCSAAAASPVDTDAANPA